MKKILIVVVGVVVVGVMIVFLKDRKAVQQGAPAPMNNHSAAIDSFLVTNPSEAAAPQLRRLSTAFKARPSQTQTRVLAEAAVRSMEDGVISTHEAAMLEEAAALAERGEVTEQQITQFSNNYPEAAGHQETLAGVSGAVSAVDNYVAQHPSEAAVKHLRRLSTAVKARPTETEVFAVAAARSVEDGAISKEEAVMLEEAASLVERDEVNERQIREFSNKYPPAARQQEALAGARDASAIDTFVAKNSSGASTKHLRSVSTAMKSRPSRTSTKALAGAAARSVEDGAISQPEAKMLEEAASLAERDEAIERQVTEFSKKYPEAARPWRGSQASGGSPETLASAPEAAAAAAAVNNAASAVDHYVSKHPEGAAAKNLRRLSTAMKERPDQTKVLADAAARSVEDGAISAAEAKMLEEAAKLAERGGFTPKEMAEFSKKYQRGEGLSEKPVVAKVTPPAAPAPLPSFTGKRQLVYTFKGTAQCPQKPCPNIRVSVRVSAGKWVETREGTTDGQGNYFLQMPVLSTAREPVNWQLEAHTKDLRQAELTGQRVTTDADRDITLQNNLILNPA